MRAREYYRGNTLQIKRDFGTCSVKNYFLFGFISGKQKISYDENGKLKFSNMKFVQTLEIKKKTFKFNLIIHGKNPFIQSNCFISTFYQANFLHKI